MATKRERFLQFGRTLLHKLLFSLKRFPETLIICAATAIVLIMLNHGAPGAGADGGEFLQRLTAVLALGIPLSLCLKVLFERATLLKTGLKVPIYIAAAAGLVLYYLFLLKDFEMVSLSRYVSVTLALYLAFTFIPYYYRRQNYELYVIRLFLSFLITYLFAAILYGGLAAILWTINYLFTANIPADLYTDIWLIVGGIFAPAFFLADIPAKEDEPLLERYPRVISVLLSYIVMPLILAYCAILYVYFFRILLTWQWPEVMVSHLVLWYAIISTLVIFCIFPLRGANQWIRAFISFFPKVILPLLGLMFTAMGVRVSAYGLTENRYFVLAAGLWVTGSMLYLILSRRSRNVFLPSSLALVAILAVSGPWSSYSISVLSQNRHFERVATEHGLIQEGKITGSEVTLPDEVKLELSSIITYFDSYHGIERLRALPEGFGTDQVETLLGFSLSEYLFPGDEEIYFHYYLDDEDAYWRISGYDYFMQFSSIDQRYHAGDFEVIFLMGDSRLEIIRPGEPLYSQNVADIAVKLHRDNYRKSKEHLSRQEMTYAESRDGLRLLYVFKAIGGWEKKEQDEIKIEYMDFDLFVGLEGEEPS